MRPPIENYRVTPHGGYEFDRGDVIHYGLDLGAKPGTEVYAPERMTVLAYAIDNKTPPLSGYGPGAVLAKGESGVYHVLGHLDPWAWSGIYRGNMPYKGRVYAEGELVGEVSKLNHTHWEVRTVPYPPRGAARDELTLDPREWLRGARVKLHGGGARGGGGGAALVVLLLLLLGGSRP